jgi:imidazolonepropionase
MGPTIYHNISQLVTMVPHADATHPEGRLGIVQDGALVVGGNGRLLWVGCADNVPTQYQDATHVSLNAQLLLPGLVECHTHLVFDGDRTRDYADRCAGEPYEAIAARGGGIRLTVNATRSASHERLLDLGRERMDAFRRHGVTTVEIKTGYGLSEEAEIKCLEVIAQLNDDYEGRVVATFLGAHIMPDEYRDNRAAYITLLTERLIPEIARRQLAQFVDVFCEGGAYTLDEAETIFRAACTHGLGIKVHAEQLSHTGSAALAARYGAVSADHLEHIEPADATTLAECDTVAVLLPGAGLFLGGKDIAPARMLIDAGVDVALSTDFNPGTCPSTHLPLMTTLGCSWLGLSPEESLRGITVSAAKALRLTEGEGTLRIGGVADFAIMNLPDWKHIPYRMGHNPVVQTWVNGRKVYEQGQAP